MLKIVLWAVANNCYVCVGTRSEIRGTMLWTYGSEAAYADFKAGRIKLMASHEQADGAFLLALLASSRPDLSVLLREGRKALKGRRVMWDRHRGSIREATA